MPLDSDRRALFSQVTEAIVSNPFSPTRADLDRTVAGAAAGASRDEALTAAVGRVEVALQGVDPTALGPAGHPDRRLYEFAVLFCAFHRYIPALDDHIDAQLRAGTEPCAVPFADALLTQLIAAGIRAPMATRYLGLFFQMRRAFYFIDRGLVGRAPCMHTLRQSLWNNVFTHDIGRYDAHLWDKMEDFSTILLGDTGTGKGTAAAAIGRSGFIPFEPKKGRFAVSFTEAFLAINLSQFPEALIESELFGHKKGAFTGAIDAYTGVLARCSPYGAILLDEIGEVGIPVQIKLLRVLQERQLSPVGSHETVRFRGRVIAATHRPLRRLRDEGKFRDDFYYRLCSDVIRVPSLSERLGEDPGELDLLLDAVVRRILGDAPPDLVEDLTASIARDLGSEYPWPGNVRELEQCVRRVLMTRRYRGDETVRPVDPDAGFESGVRSGQWTARRLVAQYCRLLYARHGTYEEVARRTELDRRTVKKYLEQQT